MNAFDLARTAYSPANAPFQSPRATEYALFARVTRLLKASCAAERRNFAELAHALHENRLLWTRLAADVAEAANPLPEALKARIFYLARFTAHQTSKVLNGTSDPEVLVDINTAIMRGLTEKETEA